MNDGHQSTYAFLQIVNEGRRYFKVQGKIIDLIVLNPGCLDSESRRNLYFSSVAVSPNKQV